ncbi:hypothetical protein F406_gp055 [Agrobacterium phage 7-7-1]|uniref:Uncharacterized protein n=1 Tax=Agrobacterium phage 7-7-1 TaxID=1161931 RepID=J7F8Y5_9CAUD|nr:hypothetical protein F406_gp055 [Agrobacterium phage 7-7-1]AFH19760.1 hypothetical protein 7-7-1_00062 [Agrobacterium phage 7-7-1]
MTVTRVGKHGMAYSSDFLNQLYDDLKQLAADVDDTRLSVVLHKAASTVNIVKGMNEAERVRE